MKKSLKIGFFAAAAALIMTQPAYALFTNGGFETGDYTGWTVTYGRLDTSGASPANPNWSATNSGQPPASILTASTVNPGQTLDVNPYNGTYMAKINDIVGSYHATKLFQSDTLTAADLTETVYVNWGAMLVDPNHTDAQNPYFSIKVLINGSVVNSFAANANQTNTGGTPIPPWVSAGSYSGSNLYYNHGTYSYNLAGYSAGQTIGIEMFVADCDLGGHGAYAFLDGIGTTYQPPPDNPVPEPSTMILLGGGLAGLAFWRKRKNA
jgi:hypothetical protein